MPGRIRAAGQCYDGCSVPLVIKSSKCLPAAGVWFWVMEAKRIKGGSDTPITSLF